MDSFSLFDAFLAGEQSRLRPRLAQNGMAPFAHPAPELVDAPPSTRKPASFFRWDTAPSAP